MEAQAVDAPRWVDCRDAELARRHSGSAGRSLCGEWSAAGRGRRAAAADVRGGPASVEFI